MKRNRGNSGPRRRLTGLLVFCILEGCAIAADPRPPATIEAGQAFSIPAAGSGNATFFLIAPDHVLKRTVNLGNGLQIQSSDVRTAGQYQMIICQRSCTSSTFSVHAAQPAHLSFFLHPSRVPVSSHDAIDATVFVFDRDFNLVLSPATVDFRLATAAGDAQSLRASSQNGVAWIRLNSSPREGQLRVTAVLGTISEPRVIQQVAAEACTLRMKAVETGKFVDLSTDPVRDCSGNPLPDGTIVSFTKLDAAGKSTVDTPIKKSVAQTRFSVAGPGTVSVACGVVLGNEISLRGAR